MYLQYETKASEFMKLLIASDIHGDLTSAEHIIEVMDREGCDKLVLLGDILYHGPRNDLPAGYNPKGVIELLNSRSSSILAVRGNCDTEVDQMVLTFPILADYAYICVDGLNIFATHGHKFNIENPPSLSAADILLHGHTHILTCESFGKSNTYINPGSVSIPKGGNPKTYIIYEDRCFKTYDLTGNIVSELRF